MVDRREDRQTVEVPKGTGRAGFLLAVEEILKLPRVQSINIDSKGKITFSRILLENENSLALRINFETLSPYAVIRNSEVIELPSLGNELMPIAALNMFTAVQSDKLYPLAFVGSLSSDVWEWQRRTTQVAPPRDKSELFGLPFFTDSMVDDYMLFLCAGYVRDAALLDTQKAYKIIIPSVR